MIWIENEMINNEIKKKEIQSIVQSSLRNFKLFANQKSINSLFFPKISKPQSISTFFAMFIPFQCSQAQISTRITFRWPSDYTNFQVGVEFKFHQVGGKKISEVNQRTKMEFISSLGKVNEYLLLRKSSLSIKFDLMDSLIFYCQNIFSARSNKQLKIMIDHFLQKTLVQFITFFAELNEKDFFSDSSSVFNVESFQDVLNSYQESNVKIFIKPSKKEVKKSLKACLSLIFQRAKRLQLSIDALKYRNRIIQSQQKPLNYGIKQKNIGNAIKIYKKFQNINEYTQKFKRNILLNQSVSNSCSIELNIVQFAIRKSFGTLRKRIQDSYLIQSPHNQNGIPQDDFLVFKRCKFDNQGGREEQYQQNTNQMTKSQTGQSNQYNFLMYLGNLCFPYIAKYYLDVSEDSISKFSERTIITRLQNGDLYTQVTYNEEEGIKRYSFIEYLIIFEQIVKTLVFLQENRIIHRDLKPTNILFDYRGKEKFYCKIIDFGSCYCLRQEYLHCFSSKLYTTKQFNLTYFEALKQTKGSIKGLITEQAYSTHQNFDIYAAAQTISYLLKNTLYDKRSQFLQQIINICKNPNPNLRFTAQELLAVIQSLKFAQMRKESSLFYLGSKLSQFN